MDGSFGNLKLFAGEATIPTDADPPTWPPTAATGVDPIALANRELLRPPTHRASHRDREPFSDAWFDELEHKRYARHGEWLPAALEFAKHAGEAVLLLGPGVGSDAIAYLRQQAVVTIGVSPGDYATVIRRNLARHGLSARFVPTSGPLLPFADGAFDIVTWNALHDPVPLSPQLVAELWRILKPGGKVIGLIPARYDIGFWQDVLLPLQRLYWRRPPDPTTAPKMTKKQVRAAFAAFEVHRVSKRHLRRGEMPHFWRLIPLFLLERVLGRVLVLKAFKPLSAARPAALAA
jgi:SAM-dependent methyltransferase